MKHFFLITVLFFSFKANGQENTSPGKNFSKGTYMTGIYGSGGFNNSPYFKHSNRAISPWAGYFIASNLATGLRMSFGKMESQAKKDPGGGMTTLEYNHFSLAPEVFIRYYTPRIKIKPFVQLSAGYNFQWGETKNGQGQMQKVNESNVIGNVEGGICFPIGKRFSIDAAYNWRAFSESDLFDANEKGRLKLGVSFRL